MSQTDASLDEVQNQLNDSGIVDVKLTLDPNQRPDIGQVKQDTANFLNAYLDKRFHQVM